ncbi:MAG: TDP-fucosamine acetyltransferase [Acidimicrobiaceae bacterium]|nr:TDP-fucosamine acetyltransferase [Acidimicrobiaceae bacterium]
MTLTVEKAQFATAELVVGLNRLMPQLSSSAEPLTSNDVDALIHSESTTLFIALDDANVVGTLTLIVFSIPTGRRAWIEDVVVDESSRGRGVGQELTLAAIDEARLRGVRTIDLTSRPSREAANAMYLKLGFERRETNVYRYVIE